MGRHRRRSVGTGALIAWMAIGPLQPGWAKAAGTPADLLAGATTRTASVPPAPSPGVVAAGLDDAVRGVLVQSPGKRDRHHDRHA